jgi:hypothetical protein
LASIAAMDKDGNFKAAVIFSLLAMAFADFGDVADTSKRCVRTRDRLECRAAAAQVCRSTWLHCSHCMAHFDHKTALDDLNGGGFCCLIVSGCDDTVADDVPHMPDDDGGELGYND